MDGRDRRGCPQARRTSVPWSGRTRTTNLNKRGENCIIRQPKAYSAYFSILHLHAMLTKNDAEIVAEMWKKIDEFEKSLDWESKRQIAAITRVLATVCRSNFFEIKMKILQRVCATKFLMNMNDFLLLLIADDKDDACFEQNALDSFWESLIELLETIKTLFPDNAQDNLATILETLNHVIRKMETMQCLTIKQNVKELATLMSTNLSSSKQISLARNAAGQSIGQNSAEPRPENFRQMSIIPTIHDVNHNYPFIRPLRVKEAYDSVDHYLDVQFRLLREDFVTPFRNGVREYLQETKLHRSRDLRVYRRVRLSMPDKQQDNIDVTLFFGVLNHVNWAHSKRLIFGSLLCLSHDNFKTLLFFTVSNRDDAYVKQGKILVTPCAGTEITTDLYDATIVMLECKNYFEPFSVILTAMQNMCETKFPMKKYLVNADPSMLPPAYMRDGVELEFNGFKWPVDEDQKWPTDKDLNLDETQYNAFKQALSEEIAIIQGPPGTGKTFIALKIIETLLENRKLWRNHGPIVVVCLTNHALDQFLEGIIPFTRSIVRIGSRSKSEVLEKYTLAKRSAFTHEEWASSILCDTKKELCRIMERIQESRRAIQDFTTPNAIVPMAMLVKYCHYAELRNINNLLLWLGIPQIGNLNKPPMLLELGTQASRNSASKEQSEKLNNELIFPLNHIDDRITKVNGIIEEWKIADQRTRKSTLKPPFQCGNEIRRLQGLRDIIEWNLANHPLINKRPRNQSPSLQWASYWTWVVCAHETAIQQTIKLGNEYRQILAVQTEAKEMVNLATLRKNDIIGLTTTRAAKSFAVLQSLQAPIVLVEEAAEILEAHVVCSLTKSCQHVIMIGDHKQLKPKTATMKLGTKYNLNVSLFERMVNIRGNCPQLAYQHRMRPEIASLICPSIYETLHNHESVLQYPPILGLAKNLFFLNHEQREETLDNDESWTNPFEARFLVAFTRYLMLQGYRNEDITILCTYVGQLFAITKEKNAYPQLRNIRVTSVDNYQGEECKIILLSLVRNNEEGNIGFLQEENRVCVALSRAREGLFIMGNMNNLTSKQNVWSKVKTVLEDEEALGDALPLRCQIHHDELIMVRDVADFEQSPKGGCTKMCESKLRCGHICPSICHILNKEHTDTVICKEPCKKLCPNGHACPLTCYKKCQPCLVMVERQLECGHAATMVCSDDPEEYLCIVVVERQLECGHAATMVCSADPKKYLCIVVVERQLECGHAATMVCSDDPEKYLCIVVVEHQLECGHAATMVCLDDPEEYLCIVVVERQLECGHAATMACSDDPEKYQCIVVVDSVLPFCNHGVRKRCDRPVEKVLCPWPCEIRLPCGHSCTQYCHANRDPDHIQFECLKECTNNNRDCIMEHPCKKRCFEECEKCMIKVEKISPCGHQVDVKCSEEATLSHCEDNCTRTLPCGHPCAARCKDDCTEQCSFTTLLAKPALCGHTFSVPCYLQDEDTALLDYCEEPCATVLFCGHICKGSCGSCNQKRVHVPCAENCGNILICGHKCNVPCRQVCPPCNNRCRLRCRHSKCNKKCGVPCVRCKEPCEWGCKHSKCTKRCYELCDREPCMEPCPKLLKCKHPCIGFCGDPCPRLCRVCNKKKVTELFLGGEDEPDARFVLLPDCGHCIESSGLSTWITQHSDSIQMKKCPRCNTLISTCMRIMNQIKVDIEHVQSIKRKIFGNHADLRKSQADLLETITALRQNTISKDFPEMKHLLDNLHTKLIPVWRQRRQIINSGAVEANRIVVDFLLTIFDKLNRIEEDPAESYKWLKKQIIMLVKALPYRGQISHQEVTDIQCELRRLDYMTKMHEYEIHAYRSGIISKSDETYQSIVTALKSIEKFDESQESLIRDKMIKILDMKDMIVERKMIVKAMGFKQGHWYKCPNGHFYVISECGGAMVESRCNECGASIGGRSHRLRTDNSVATEMDGATRSAWP